MSPEIIVLGSGVAGVAAALQLKRKGKKVLVLSKNGGATSVSSGSWDFGPLDGEASLEDLRDGPAWQQLYGKLLVDVPGLANPTDLAESCESLAKDLKLTFSFKKPFLLPTSSGKWKRTFGAQSLQTRADLSALRNKKIGFVACDQWRFRADLVLKSLVGLAEALGTRLDISLVKVTMPGTQTDWPLPHVATRLQYDADFRTQLIETLRKNKYDTYLFPPLFLEAETAESIQKDLGANLAECLSTLEPVAGLRLQKSLERLLDRQEIRRLEVTNVQTEVMDDFVKKVRALTKQNPAWEELTPRAVVLATGKFFGGGVALGFHRISEPVFNLPLFIDRDQPKTYRSELEWRESRFKDEQSWARLGLWVDREWRPMRAGRTPALKNVVAAGSLLGGLDFARENVGLGLFAYSGRQCGHVLQ